jgi:hypothetical protein
LVILNAVIHDWLRGRTRHHASRQQRQVIAVGGKKARAAKNGGGTRVFLFVALDRCTGTVIGQEYIG